MMTPFKLQAMTDQQFDRGIEEMDVEMAKLKEILER